MSKFHSMVSRRDFMKALGITGAGIGATALVAPVFHDLDELASNNAASYQKPWYAKEVDQPTMEVDWKLVKRFDATLHGNSSSQLYWGNDEWNKVLSNATTFKTQWIKENKPGYRLLDVALADNASNTPSVKPPWVPAKGTFTTPESFGVAKWQGTPDENARILRSALKFYGASMVGYTALDENTKKLVYSNGVIESQTLPNFTNRKYYYYEFEDVETGYEDGFKRVIPTKAPLWIVEVHGPYTVASMRCAPSGVTRGSNSLVNSLLASMGSSIQRFLAQLGYQCLNGCTSGGGTFPRPALDALNGIGEVCRDVGQTITTLFGQSTSSFSFMTDMPLTPTKPIDAGITRFCRACTKCADSCPSGAITHDDLSWEVPGTYSCSGHKQFQCETDKCKHFATQAPNCVICQSACVFLKEDSAGIHETVKAIVSKTSIFNSFFTSMDTLFGYGPEECQGPNNPLTGVFNPRVEDWWNSEQTAFGFFKL